MNKIRILSISCIPLRADTPINKKTPYSTAIGIRDKTLARKILRPISIDITKVVPRCSRMPTKVGLSPGAVFSDIIFKELMCDKASTVAATNQGRPKTEQPITDIAITKRSKWYPFDF